MKVIEYKKLLDKISDNKEIYTQECIISLDIGEWYCKDDTEFRSMIEIKKGDILKVKEGFTHNSYEIRKTDGILKISSSHLKDVNILDYVKFKENFIDVIIGKRQSKLNKLG